jgi:hypothetical protein
MKETSQAEWIEEELMDVDFGDRRLSKRCKLLLGRLAADPQASINGACHGWAETHAAYQFFDHDEVDEQKILSPHRQATLQRMESSPVVLLVQDTTELDYTQIKTKLVGAGPLDKPYRRGSYNHLQATQTYAAGRKGKLPLAGRLPQRLSDRGRTAANANRQHFGPRGRYLRVFSGGPTAGSAPAGRVDYPSQRKP